MSSRAPITGRSLGKPGGSGLDSLARLLLEMSGTDARRGLISATPSPVARINPRETPDRCLRPVAGSLLSA